MEQHEYLRMDAVAAAEAVRSGTTTADDLRAAAATRFAEVGPAINAVVEWYEDPTPALVDGDRALAGVPFLRKDFGATEAGRPVEMGSRLAAGLVATDTSPYVRRMTGAGVQILGRTTVPEMAQHATTESAATGITRNPLDVTRSPGGSSGGAAAAVAAGIVPVAHASDAAGSIRIPAAVTGLIGLKPSRGVVPEPLDRWRGLVTELVVARSVRDVEVSWAVLTGPEPGGDGPSVTATLARSPRRWSDPTGTTRPTRIGLAAHHWAGHPPDPGVMAAVDATAALLADRGHRVEPIATPFDYDRLMTTWFPLFCGGFVDVIHRVAALTGRPLDDAHLEPITREVIDRVAALEPGAVAAAHRTADVVTSQLEAGLDGFDVLLTPTLDRPSIPLERMAGFVPLDAYLADGDEWFDRLYLANVTGWPALSVPAPPLGRDRPGGSGPGGWPATVGVQLMARPGTDLDLLALGREIVGDGVVAAVDPGPVT